MFITNVTRGPNVGIYDAEAVITVNVLETHSLAPFYLGKPREVCDRRPESFTTVAEFPCIRPQFIALTHD